MLVISKLKRIFSRGRPSVTDHGDTVVARALDALRGLPAQACDIAAIEHCLDLMRRTELVMLSADSFKLPYHFWWSRMPAHRRKDLAQIVMERLSDTRSPRDRLVMTALLARLQAAGQPLKTLLNIRWRQHLDALTPVLAEELCALLHQQRVFPKLHVICDHAISNLSLDNRQRQLFCDWYVQAAYQMIKGQIFRNNLTAVHVQSLREAVNRAEAVLGSDAPNLAHHRALLACVEGDLEAAVVHHTSVRAGSGYNTQFFRAGNNLVSIAHMQALADGATDGVVDKYPFLDRLSMNLRHRGVDIATLVACDKGYFDAYIDGFADSFGYCNPGAVLHVHAIGFTPDDARLDRLEENFDIRVNVTFDPGPDQEVPGDIWRGYCAGARYIHLPAYLEKYHRVIVNDIDGIVHTSMNKLWQGREGRLQLSTLALEDNRKGHFAFWSNIGAGAFGVEALDSHKRFARALANYLIERFDVCLKSGDRFFFTDQVGLLLAVLAFRKDTPMIRMPQVFRQSSQTAQVGRDSAKRNAQRTLLQELKKE